MNPAEMLNAGLSVIPIEKNTKRAAVNWGSSVVIRRRGSSGVR